MISLKRASRFCASGSCIAWTASFSQCEGTLMKTVGFTSGRRVRHVAGSER